MHLFYFSDNAPVSKGLMGCMFLTCTALNVPLFAHMKKYLICKLPEVLLKGEVSFYCLFFIISFIIMLNYLHLCF